MLAPPPPRRDAVRGGRARLLAGALAAALAVGAGGCTGAPDRPRRPEAPAVWADAGALETLTFDPLDRLRRAGVRELFVEAGRLDWTAGGQPRVEPSIPPPPPRRFPATLVVLGDAWPAELGEGGAEAAAEALAGELRRLAQAAEAAGYLPLGFHFAPAPAASGQRAAVLAALRRRLDPSRLLSAEIDRRRLAAGTAGELPAAVDFLVAPLYGQPPGSSDDPEAWSLDAVETAAQRLEELGVDYMVQVDTVGRAEVIDGSGRPVAVTTETSLGRILADNALAPGRGLVLEGWDRRVDTLEATRATRVAGLPLAPRQSLRVVHLAVDDLLALGQRLAGLEHHRGELFYRLPGADEGLAAGVEALAAAASGEAPAPGLEIAATPLSSGGGRMVLRVEVRNRGVEPTGVARLDHNYVEVTVSGGVVARAEAGRFQRYGLRHEGRDATNMVALRNADSVRLFVPVLDPGAAVTSGEIEVRATAGGALRVAVGGRFVLPGGAVVDLPPVAVAAP